MRTLNTLTNEELTTIRQYLLARPFTETERAYYSLCWLPVTQAQLDAINAAMPANHVCTGRTLNGQIYINLDLISDAIDNGRLSAILPMLEDLEWQYINPWEWPEPLDENGDPIPHEKPELIDGVRPSAWVQPLGAHDAYDAGALVYKDGKVWENLTPANPFAPGVSGWREHVTSGYPDWVQPTGAHDAYSLGAEVTHNGSNWRSLYANNVWVPGVFGWEAF